MKLIITIGLMSESFTDSETGEYFDRFKAVSALEPALAWVAFGIGYGDTEGTIKDPNGNTVGSWKIAEELEVLG